MIGLAIAFANLWNRTSNARIRSIAAEERRDSQARKRRQEMERERQTIERLNLARDRERRLREAHQARMGRLPICQETIPVAQLVTRVLAPSNAVQVVAESGVSPIVKWHCWRCGSSAPGKGQLCGHCPTPKPIPPMPMPKSSKWPRCKCGGKLPTSQGSTRCMACAYAKRFGLKVPR
jgi:hypothetical protein